jgi:hypothetical protein
LRRAALTTYLALALVPAAATANFHHLDGAVNIDPSKSAQSVRVAGYGGQPLAVWAEGTYPVQVHARRFDGTSWLDAGSALNVNGASSPSLAIIEDTPHVAFTEVQDVNGNGVDQLHAKSFDGADWSAVGGALNVDPAHSAYEPAIGGFGNNILIGRLPWVAWSEWTGTPGSFAVHVKRWDGSSWTEVGSSPNTPGVQSNFPSLAQVVTGRLPSQFTLYLAWSEYDTNAPSSATPVRISHLSSNSWTPPITLNVNSNRSASVPSLATVSNVLYATWVETDGSHYQVRVKRFDGQNFESLGGSLNVDSSKDANFPSIADVGGVPYLSWSEDGKIYVRRFDGTNWVLLAGPLNTTSAQAPSIANVGGLPTVGWEEFPHGFVAREVAPVCTGSSVAVPHDASATVALTCNEGARSIVAGPGHGTLSALDPAAGKVTYTPAPGFVGADSLTFKANDGMLDSNVATVNLNVAAANGSQATLAKLSKLRESNTTFVVGRRPTRTIGQTAAKRRRHPKGTTFSFSLDQPAKVTVAFRRALPGRRVGRSCKAPTHRLRHRRKCVRLRSVGSLTRDGHAGNNRVAFSGRIGRKTLRPGRYRAVFTATNAAGASPPRTLRFKIVKR